MKLSRRLIPDIATLQAFECAARHGSFTQAANELNLTQSAVSRQIKDQVWATTSEIALADEIVYQPLMHWVRINHVAHGIPMVNQVVKTAAVLQTISRQGEYVRGETDDEIEASGIASHSCSSCSH